MTPDRLLEALDPEQREVATALNGPVCVLAGAGTGKTRAMTHRIAYGVASGIYKPTEVLAVTFTARAAGEMRSRLRELGAPTVQARTFHSAALRQLQYFWPQAIGGSIPRLAEHKAPLLAEAGHRLRINTDRATIRDLAAELEWAKVSMLTDATYAAAVAKKHRPMPAGLDVATMTSLLRVYEEVKIDRGVLDFEDVLLLMAGILTDHEDIARTVRSQYRHFVVDEYQDVSLLQQRLLDLWLGDRDDLCVVGDASQTIYSFTGASPEHLLGFTRRFDNATLVKLVRDYRSTPQVVSLANRLLATASGLGRLELIAARESGPQPVFKEFPDDEAEATGIARLVRQEVDSGTPASSIAILYRTNAQSAALEQSLAAAGVGYLVRGGERFFSRKEVREAMLLIRGAARSVAPGEPIGQNVRDVLGSLGWSEHPPETAGAVRERWESLQAIVALADEIAARESDVPPTLRDVITELEDRANNQHAPTVQGVTLASLHAAKGLEWASVYLVGLNEGLMPISFADTTEAVDEERRLLYVGITRAETRLTLSWSLSRSPGGRANRRVSRFIAQLRPTDTAGARSRPRPAAKNPTEGTARKPRSKKPLPTHCAGCGKLLHSVTERKLARCAECPPAYNEELFEALKAWRLRHAQEGNVPAFVVFTDVTLMAIAELCPSDLAALAEVPGVGPAKLERYGEQVLSAVSAHSGDAKNT
ncbi:ATP-dependent DNA helicase UvrD2 [Saxibacter everestensis]|uniref:ATP-dependent DNA helicase UvrD2 n=1 Tax=Saxibacter everestensis TaxID=2909229 RepID=UPI0032E35F34